MNCSSLKNDSINLLEIVYNSRKICVRKTYKYTDIHTCNVVYYKHFHSFEEIKNTPLYYSNIEICEV